jgi:PAS domain S-box-containing protein
MGARNGGDEEATRALALERAREFEAVFESIQDAILVFGKNGEIVRRNKAANKHHEILADVDTVGMPRLRRLDGSNVPPSEFPARRALRGERVELERFLFAAKDGTERVGEASATPLLVDDEVVGAVAVVRDVTQERQAGEDQERLRALLDHNPSLVFMKDDAGRYVYMNEAYENGFARTRDWLGKTDFDFWPHQSAELFRSNDTEVMESGHPRQFLEDSTDLDGIRRCWFCYKFPFSDTRNRKFLGGIGIDATDRVVAEESLREANRLLEAADQEKNEFIGMLSHELRNPLAPIKNSLYVLEHAVPGGDQARQAHAIILRQVDQLSRLVDDLLDVTRIARNKIQLQRRHLELNELVRRSLEDHRTVFDRAAVRLIFEPAEVPLFVHVDRNRIAQIVGNLLQNAAKFTPRGGTVKVRLAPTPDGRLANLRITDTGLGMTPQMMARLFQPFAQADTSLDRSKGGLGLGLALVKGLIDLHGGSISASSQGLGLGTEFVVNLPLDQQEMEQSGRHKTVMTGFKRRVLIIEDNVDAADSLRDVLRCGEHEVEVAYNGPDGLAKARTFKPDTVLCDIGLPVMDGYAVARAFRADEVLKNVLLVAVSGYTLPQDLERAAEAGFEHHLSKPPSLEKLAELLRTTV